MQTPVEQIKERLSIVDVVGEYVKLERAGKAFRTRCPFHNEKTASFYVSPERGSWHCFGCHRGGDIFSFMQEIEGYDFRAALEALATRAGVTLTNVNPKEQSLKHELLRLLEEATLFYQRALLTTAEPKEYLKNRGIVAESVRRFRIGYAPREWRALFDHLKSKGFSPARIEDSGLAVRRGDSSVSLGAGHYDRFRGRIIFPIGNTEGSVIGFSGRILPGADTDTEKEAKYINTPQTALYDKSRALFGYREAKESIRHEDLAILVEGQMDVVLSHQAGVRNVVAVSGTALTTGHLGILRRLTEKLLMAFDADAAGIAAAERSIYTALEAGFDVSVATLPEGRDPADLVRELPSRWHDALQGALHVIDFYLTVLSRTVPDVRQRGRAVRERVLPLVSRLRSEIDKAHFIGKIAASLSIPEEPLWRELSRVNAPKGTGEIPLAGKISALVPDQPVKTAQSIAHDRLRGICYWQERSKRPLIEVAALTETLAEFEEGASVVSDARKEELIFEAEQMYGSVEKLDVEIKSLLQSLSEYRLRESFSRAMEDLKRAEVAGDTVAVQTALKECQRITQQLNNLQRHG